MFKLPSAGVKTLALALCSALFFAGCGNLQNNPADQLDSAYLSESDVLRSVNIANLSKAEITVKGTNLSETSLGTLKITGFSDGVSVSGIPVGTNRIITVQGLDSNGSKITGLTYGAVATVESTTKKVAVNASTTALAKVFERLLIDEVDLTAVNVSDFDDVIDGSVNYSLINTNQIAWDYEDGCLGKASDYFLQTGAVCFDTYLADGNYSAEICDPLSAKKTAVSAGTDITISGVAPGAWTFNLYNKAGSVVYSTALNVESGKITDLGAVDTGIVVVVDAGKYSSYNYLYAWVNNKAILKSWPGAQMSKIGSNYVYQINNRDSIGLLVNTARGSKLVSSDLSISKPGVYKISSSSSGTLTPEETYVYKPVVIGKRNSDSSIEVHAYGYTSVWAWNKNGVSGNEFKSWPGASMTNEGNGWYSYKFDDAASINIIFSINGSSQTSDLSVSDAGKYWYKSGKWYTQNPDGPVAVSDPKVSISVPAGSYTSKQSVKLTSTNASDVIYYTLDGKTPSSSSTKYTGEITISKDCTLKAIAYNADAANQWSTVASAAYKISLASGEKITVHAYKYTYVWAWKNGPVNLFSSWPGAAMTSEGNSWYGYTFEDCSSINLIFSQKGSSQTSDLSLTAAGEYWFKNGSWYKENPDRPGTPVVKASLAAGTYNTSKSVTLSSTNASDKIYYTTDGTTPSASSKVYSGAITVSKSMTLKAVGYNAEAATPWGSVLSVSYVIDVNADFTAPVITPSKEPGRYNSATSVYFTISDDKSKGFTVYYTTDGSTPTKNSSVYATCRSGSYKVTGGSFNISMDTAKTIRLLAVDASGNGTSGTYYYNCTSVSYTASRWDPRQESIYFLLTARWFDGDAANTVGDEWCSPEGDPTWRGDFKGLVEKMDYIKALGFTCIWITPVVQNRGPLAYHGYHAWDMYKEDARLCSNGYDFQRVIDEAHARGMKICLDVVLQHSGRMGLKDFAEIKYNRDPKTYPVPQGWENFKYDEKAYAANNYKHNDSSIQKYPNNWEYDGLKSPGKYPEGWTIDGVDVGGQVMPPSAEFIGSCRPFTAADLKQYPYLAMTSTGTASKYQWPTTESYKLTVDGTEYYGYPETGSLTLSEYAQLPKLHFHGWANGFNDSGMFDVYPAANLRSIHEDCPDLNTESKEVQDYVIGAYKRYIAMGVDMFRVDTLMHIDKQTVNDVFWPAFFEAAAEDSAKNARGGADFFAFGEVANFVCNLGDKPVSLRQYNYTYSNSYSPDISEGQTYSYNSYLDGNNYRSIDKTKKAVPESDYVVSTIDILSHNNFCNGEGGGYGKALSTSGAYWDSTYLTWYADSHDYGPNKYNGRYTMGEYAPLWSMLFTFRGIPIIYYGNEIDFKKNCGAADWPGSVKNSLESTGRAYFGDNLAGTVKATDFAEYTASGAVAQTLQHKNAKHLRDLNRLRNSIPALQMGQFSTEGHSGGWAGYKRRYTGTNKITGEAVDSYVLVGVGAGRHSFSGVLNGTYVDAISGATMTVSGGSCSFTAHGSDNAALGVWVLTGLATPAPGKVCKESPFLGF